MLLRFQKAAVRKKYETGNQAFSIRLRFLTTRVKRFGKDGTALKLRELLYNLAIMPAWSDAAESERHIRWADGLWKAMQPFSSGGVYVNDLGNEGEDRVKAAYGTNYERLVSLKNKYDPSNLFRFNQN